MSERGFTLIETLVALAIGAMLLGSISWVISGLVKDLKAAEQSQNPRAMLDAASLLDNILGSARFTDGDGKSLKRDSANLAFEMLAPTVLGKPGYVSANLAAVQALNGNSLVLFLPGSDLPDTIVLDGADDIDFAYETDSAQIYSDPYIRQINISVRWNAEKDAKILSVRPRIDSDGACVFDPVSQQCRS